VISERQALGESGEAVAASHLESRGYRIVARRWRGAGREIDLIAEKDGVVAFVEVKTRSEGALESPETAVDWRKRRQIAAAARVAVRRWSRPVSGFRFDVVSVTWRASGPQVEHFKDAFRLQ
jgi:putative endonuclease